MADEVPTWKYRPELQIHTSSSTITTPLSPPAITASTSSLDGPYGSVARSFALGFNPSCLRKLIGTLSGMSAKLRASLDVLSTQNCSSISSARASAVDLAVLLAHLIPSDEDN